MQPWLLLRCKNSHHSFYMLVEFHCMCAQAARVCDMYPQAWASRYAGELVNLVSARMAPCVTDHCIRLMLHGDVETSDGSRSLPNPFVMDKHLPELLKGLEVHAPPETITGAQMMDWLPDLADAEVGRPKLMNPRNVR